MCVRTLVCDYVCVCLAVYSGLNVRACVALLCLVSTVVYPLSEGNGENPSYSNLCNKVAPFLNFYFIGKAASFFSRVVKKKLLKDVNKNICHALTLQVY